MKKTVKVIFFFFLFIQPSSSAIKNIGQGLTLNIPNNYEYFEITISEIYSEFPEFKSQNNNEFGIGDKTKIVIISKNKKTIELIKEASSWDGFERLKGKYWDPLIEFLTGEEMEKLYEKEFIKMKKDPKKMSQKQIEATILKISQKPSFQKKISKLVENHPSINKFKNENLLDATTIILVADKKISNDFVKLLETSNPKDLKKEIKNLINKAAKEDPSLKSLKKWKFELKKNYKGDMYLYSDDSIEDPYFKQKASYAEFFATTYDEKIFLVYSLENNNSKKTNLLEIIRPTGLIEKYSKKNKTDINVKKKINKPLKNQSKKIYIVKHDQLPDAGEWRDSNRQKALEKCIEATPDWGGTNCFVVKVEDFKNKKIEKPTQKNKIINNDITEQLIELNELYKSGVLTKEEFTKAKTKLLD